MLEVRASGDCPDRELRLSSLNRKLPGPRSPGFRHGNTPATRSRHRRRLRRLREHHHGFPEPAHLGLPGLRLGYPARRLDFPRRERLPAVRTRALRHPQDAHLEPAGRRRHQLHHAVRLPGDRLRAARGVLRRRLLPRPLLLAPVRHPDHGMVDRAVRRAGRPRLLLGTPFLAPGRDRLGDLYGPPLLALLQHLGGLPPSGRSTASSRCPSTSRS